MQFATNLAERGQFGSRCFTRNWAKMHDVEAWSRKSEPEKTRPYVFLNLQYQLTQDARNEKNNVERELQYLE